MLPLIGSSAGFFVFLVGNPLTAALQAAHDLGCTRPAGFERRGVFAVAVRLLALKAPAGVDAARCDPPTVHPPNIKPVVERITV